MDLSSDSDKSIISGVNEILGTPQLIFREPKTISGKNCTEKDCQQFVDIRVGKKLSAVADQNNSGNSFNIGNILPQGFWIDDNITK